ncbi:MAG: DNA mismatch repair protein MutL [Candidatus Roseilinea sp.]|nr:MAG: DNA mismatch repair protein MutL [Candidatus Roseilinea sp.]
MPIHILPDALVARIAAGEVVERPASVVKELVENAIDAGATDIRIECAEGGKRLIRVTDNGSGIPAAEAALAFAHHATSKLARADDLAEIHTLGFRGEALASIASVSQVTCITRHADEAGGTLLRFDGGRLITQERIGRTPGTTMTVEHLFARVPARLKFLKSTQTERGHIDGVVTRYALAYPHIRFTLVHDGRVNFQSLGTGNLRDVLVEVYGADATAQMVEVGDAGHMRDWRLEIASISNLQFPISVYGYASLPTLDHANRSKITLFVNGRPVQDAKLSYAVVQAYHTLLMTGRYPVAVILVRVPPAEVDVNVHPAKAEVRFRDADAVFGAVQRAVRRALLDNMTPPAPPSLLSQWPNDRQESGATALVATDETPSIVEPTAQPPLTGSEAWERVGIARQTGALGGHVPVTDAATSSAPMTQPSPLRTQNLPALRILGQLAESYILAEGPEGLYLIDQHAAHERVLWERLLAQHELGSLPSQTLLDPVPVTVPAESAYLLEGQRDMLRDLGFEIEPFGGNTFLVRAVPALMIQDDIATALRQIVADLEMGDAALRKDLEARVLRRVCKRMAIKAGRVLSFAEMQALVRDLEACESPRTCPHGRPTMIYIGLKQIEKEFGRLG